MRCARRLLLGLAIACLLPAATSAREWLALRADRAVPGPDAPVVQPHPGGGLRLPVPFANPRIDRVFWDFDVRSPDPAATAIAVELECDDPAALRAVTLHLQSGGHWLSAQADLDGPGRRTLYFSTAEFSAESGQPDWRRASVVRLSAWKGAGRDAELILHSIRAHVHAVAILRGGDQTAPGETAFAAQCAQRARHLFEQAGIPAAILPEEDLASTDLRPFRWLVLPYNPQLPPAEFRILERYLRRDGRLAVFYQAHSGLAKAMGVRVRPYATQNEDWSTISFDPDVIPGLPAGMPHRTRHLLPVQADSRKAHTLGWWRSVDGIPDRQLPAAAGSPRGLWFSHVPPLATPSAIQWLAASIAASDARYQPELQRLRQQSAQRDQQARELLAGAAPPEKEIRAVWALPIPPRLRRPTMKDLAARGINVVYEHLGTAGFLHYPVDADGPRQASDLGQRRSRRFLQTAIDIAREESISLQAWIVCWSLDGVPDARIAPLRAEGRLMQDAHGNHLNWLCPSHPDNRAFLLDALRDLARQGVDGIHLDYLRYPAQTGCFSPATRIAFEAFLGQSVPDWPASVQPGARQADAYDRFRREEMSRFVRDAHHAVREIHPPIVFSAAVYPTPESAAENGQDWPRWLHEGWLDHAAPMLYERDADRFADRLERAVAAAPAPGRILPGIGTSADESQLDALATAEQWLAAHNRRTAGVALFQLDSDLIDRILFPR